MPVLWDAGRTEWRSFRRAQQSDCGIDLREAKEEAKIRWTWGPAHVIGRLPFLVVVDLDSMLRCCIPFAPSSSQAELTLAPVVRPD